MSGTSYLLFEEWILLLWMHKLSMVSWVFLYRYELSCFLSSNTYCDFGLLCPLVTSIIHMILLYWQASLESKKSWVMHFSPSVIKIFQLWRKEIVDCEVCKGNDIILLSSSVKAFLHTQGLMILFIMVCLICIGTSKFFPLHP